MTIELDHLFICSEPNASEIEQILNLGLVEGRSNIHQGQGTANRCIFFRNFMLELLFAIDETELSNPAIKPTHLRERCNYHHTGYSPFGIAFRRTQIDADLPFKTWAYKPPYLPDDLQIDIAKNTTPCEPLLFVVPFYKAQDRKINHPARMQEVTKVRITIPFAQSFSEAISKVAEYQDLVEFNRGQGNLVAVEYDRAIQQRKQDFRPHLPLAFYW